MPKLVNLGSLCIDYVYAVDSIAQPGVTVASQSRSVFAGGKGLNQSIAASQAGAEVAHFGAVGPDGDLLVQTLREHGVDVGGVLTLEQPSGHAFIQVDGQGQNAIVIHGGANRSGDPRLTDLALASTQPQDWLLLQNEIDDLKPIIEAGTAQSLRMALNLAPIDQRISAYPYELLALLIVNEQEAMALSQAPSAEQAFHQLVASYPATSLVVTRGHLGALAYDAELQQQWQVGSYQVEAVDETAAGDAYVGYLMAQQVAGLALSAGLANAAAAGALAVTQAGAAPSIPAQAAVAELMAGQTLEIRQI